MKVIRPNTMFYGDYFIRNSPSEGATGFAFETTEKNWLRVAKKDSETFEADIQEGFIKVRASYPTSDIHYEHKEGWLDMDTVRLAVFGGDFGAGGDNDGEFSPFEKAGLVTVPFSWLWFLLLLPVYLFYKWLSK